MHHDQIDVGFSEETFYAGTHICLVFRDETERQRIVAQFVEGGVLHDERVLYFADSANPSDVISWLTELDVAISGKDDPFFSADSAASVYYPTGQFDPEEMCETLKTSWTTCHDAGYPNSRVTGEMSWALRDVPGTDRIIEYEAAVNEVLKTHPITAMCQYDANRFSGDVIFRALQVHPYMVMNRQLMKNPYYIVEQSH
ncbi:MAG: MEDS domain-containing protein [Spirochaeta sp.]|nr:MEDS domain-containing protein [Spirochaeta sp.]